MGAPVILQEVGFSLNTLRLHLAILERQGMAVEGIACDRALDAHYAWAVISVLFFLVCTLPPIVSL